MKIYWYLWETFELRCLATSQPVWRNNYISVHLLHFKTFLVILWKCFHPSDWSRSDEPHGEQSRQLHKWPDQTSGGCRRFGLVWTRQSFAGIHHHNSPSKHYQPHNCQHNTWLFHSHIHFHNLYTFGPFEIYHFISLTSGHI